MQDEKTFKRYATYSIWHRWKSVLRFIQNPDIAKALYMIDLDNVVYIEWRKDDYEPLALIETYHDDAPEKNCRALARLGELASMPVYVVRYRPTGTRNPKYPNVENAEDISRFRVRRLWPNPEGVYREFTPKEYAHWLVQLREQETRSFLRGQGWELPLL